MRWREHESVGNRGSKILERDGWLATVEHRGNRPCGWIVYAKRGGGVNAARGLEVDQDEAKRRARACLEALIVLEGVCPSVDHLLPDGEGSSGPPRGD